MCGKTVVITGATSGLGLQSARDLARMGASIALHGRNPDKLKAVARQLSEENPHATIDIFCHDLSLLSQTCEFADRLQERYPAIDVLMNNAGISTQYPCMTVEGFEKTFATNHLSHFLLTNILLGRLVNSCARIINVSSCEHSRARFNPGDLQSLKSFRMNIPYARSKLYNIMFTYELDNRLKGTCATANAVNPGRVRTEIGKNDTPFYKTVKGALDALASVSVEEGARPQVYLASYANLEGISGKYYDRMIIAPSSKASCNREHWKTLWDMSAEMCGKYMKGWQGQ
jgi:NAD(P)-dependent dehydrogenase (short-subunit alcohol dehydrogenase family)